MTTESQNVPQPRHLDIDALTLMSGPHKEQQKLYCVMEAVAYIAGEPHSDSPACSCPALAAWLRRANDSMSNEDRQLLKPFIRKMVGSRASKEVEMRRACLLTEPPLTTTREKPTQQHRPSAAK